MDDLRALYERARRLLLRHRRVAAALLAGGAVVAVLQTLAPDAPPTRPVVVAATDLPSGARLTGSDVAVVDSPPALVPSGAASAADLVVGSVLAGPVRRGEPLTDRRVVGSALLAGLRPGSVAAPVPVSEPGELELLQVGDRVDVFAARRSPANLADLVVRAAPVVALPSPADDTRAGDLVVVAASRTQAAALAQAAAVAPLTLAVVR